MACRAGGKRDACITGLMVGPRRVTLHARHVLMCAGERETRARVIEIALVNARSLPFRRRVASRTVLSKPALVLVLVAGRTAYVEARPGVVQILTLQQRARGDRDVPRVVATAACHVSMIAVEHIAGLRVIEAV